MTKLQKLTVLLWDEVSLAPQLQYDYSNDRIIGCEDWQLERTCNIADHALVLMIKGIVSNWKLPFAYYFSKSQTSSNQLMHCIKTVVKAVEEAGLIILAMVFDQNTTNVAAINKLLMDTDRVCWKKNTEKRIENHTSAYGGHKGIAKTFKRVRERYYWPSLKADVQKYVNECESCQLKKLTRMKTRVPMTITDTPGRAFDKVALDIVGPLPMTTAGNSYILTMQDLLTKYSLAAPLKNANAMETADAFVQTLVCRFGAPKAILTDQGSHFVNALMTAVAKKFKITHFRTSAFHPQSNGSLKRSHHVLTEYLKHYISRTNWDKWLDYAMFSYNTRVHEGTHFTPHELVFGQLARMPTADEKQTVVDNESYNAYFQELQTRNRETQTKAGEHLRQVKVRSKIYYDKRVHNETFQISDRVYLLKENCMNKFDDQYTGPYTVVEIMSKDDVKIRIKNKEKVVHVNRLKNLALSPPPRPSQFLSCVITPIPNKCSV